MQRLQKLEAQEAKKLQGFDHVDVFNHVVRRRDHQLAEDLTELNRLRLEDTKARDCSDPPHVVLASRFWAVIIGIDEYTHAQRLQCCVSDAQLFEEYLMGDLGMPKERIQLLLGSKEYTSPDDPMYPSHTHITDMLFSLIDNPEIEERDNTIIYYSGHGSSYPCSSYHDVEKPDLEMEISFSGTGYIKALCPINRDTCDTNGKPVPDISDQEFNMILTLISRSKGHHITVILDCCHSSGVSRDVPPPGSRTSPGTRQATLRDMLLTRENNLMKFPGCPSILTKDWHPNMDSHVALVACKAYQFAKETWVDGVDGSRVCVGVFTHSLVRLLRSGYYKAETKYEDLLLGFDKSSHQTPVVVGRHRDARIWYQAETHHEIDTTSYLSYVASATIPVVFLLLFILCID
ncbi:uncharacterized protein ARMOST_21450 [Armillaria ostoyae]|uniref:Peptidase C14 caspase domain-containing protein n=1 Tax=Armillaria ostoyae TaxID=47428 RepID=A0A284SA43_ARMOS|nr:uncharacterized protein ARMOST_21450 [Armillaria ostoyae]